MVLQRSSKTCFLCMCKVHVYVFVLPFIFEFPFKLFSSPSVFKLLARKLADDWNSYGNTC